VARARLVAHQHMAEAGAQQRVVERQAGAAGREGWELLVLSAPDEPGLDAATARLAAELESDAGRPLPEVARELRAAPAHAFRRVLVARDREDALGALRARDPRRVLTAREVKGERPVVFLFPGLGEQYVGMARGLYGAEPVFRAEIDRCAEILRPHLGADLREILYPPGSGPAPAPAPAATGFDLRRMLGRDAAAAAPDPATERLNRTEVAQPAVFAVDYALARLFEGWGLHPRAVIGHSLGEYVAACVAGILPLEDALALVAERARLIAELPGGAMLGLPFPEAEARPLLGPELDIAAVNSPTTCVAAGPTDAVAALEARLAAEGQVARRLQTTHAFHSRMMEPVIPRFRERLASVRLARPRIPLVSNVTGSWIRAEEATDPEYWVRHLRGTVRFAEGVLELAGDPDTVLLEVGPGQTLGGFARQSGLIRQVVLPSVRFRYDRQSDEAFLLSTLGKLWLTGASVKWAGRLSTVGSGVSPAGAGGGPRAE
ncbi:MAG TPA: acyltransferase domain-containing protein, partial [Longimicrobiaceae bacterium]|nr:acyltransferase domain-containing protein [Longimicrobiaceae bacterium]